MAGCRDDFQIIFDHMAFREGAGDGHVDIGPVCLIDPDGHIEAQRAMHCFVMVVHEKALRPPHFTNLVSSLTDTRGIVDGDVALRPLKHESANHDSAEEG
ncbi:hypothetical protein CVM50_17735 [Pseudooceanicola marinus]|nr:hypothetical protein CVM50_17735 [Pseudooceanicola marinus]